MRKFIFIIAALLLALPVYSDDIPESEVPQAVRDNFYSMYNPDKVEWELEGEDYEAEFYEDGKKKTVTFAPFGTMVSLKTKIETSELPAIVTGAVWGEYPEAVITEAEETISGDITEYEIEIKNDTEERELKYIVSNGGQIIEKTKDKKDD